jgi:VRR-NUC domain
VVPVASRPVESEDDFQRFVTETATLYGWRWAHFRTAMVGGRYVTPQSGDKGFPDLVLVRDGVVLVVELKSEDGRFRPGQREWLAALGPYGRCWRPRDKQAVLDTLRRKP